MNNWKWQNDEKKFIWWTQELENLYSSFHRPHPKSTWYGLAMELHADLRDVGVAFVWKVKNSIQGGVFEVYRLPPIDVFCVVVKSEIITWRIRTPDGRCIVVNADDVIRLGQFPEASQVLHQIGDLKVASEGWVDETNTAETWRDRPSLL